MNLVQRIYRYIRYRNFLQLCKGIPVINLILQPQINRYFFARVLFIFFVAFPVVGIFRRAYIKNKFNTYLKSNQKKTQIQLKQSIAEFNIKADAGVEYVIIVALHQLKEKDENSISDIDNQNSSKIFNMIEEAQENQQAFQMKWAFLGSKKLYEVIENSRNALKPKNKLPVQFHEKESENKQSKVYLVAIQDEGEKVIMQWNAGVPYKEITKYIAKHKFKKYLKLVNF